MKHQYPHILTILVTFVQMFHTVLQQLDTLISGLVITNARQFPKMLLTIWSKLTDYKVLQSLCTFSPIRVTMNLSTFARNATQLDLLIEETKGNIRVKRLRRRNARKGETLQRDSSSGRPGLGSHSVAKGSYIARGDISIGGGQLGTLNPVNSLGKQFLGDKDKVRIRANQQYKSDRRAFVLGL